jgi:hypothetical protein
LTISIALVSRVETDQNGDELQVVLDPVLKLLEQHVCVAKLPRKFLALRLLPFGDVDERDDAIGLPGILVLDDAGIGFHEREFRLLALEGPHEIVAPRKRISEREVRVARGRLRYGAGQIFLCL